MIWSTMLKRPMMIRAQVSPFPAPARDLDVDCLTYRDELTVYDTLYT